MSASLDERISWTTGFAKAYDKVVLAALAFFADFETGRNARPGMRRLVERADLPKRTVERALHRLAATRDKNGNPIAPWITITQRRHLGPTTYAINVERLATSRAAARLVSRRRLSANLADNDRDPLSANGADLSANVADSSGGTVRQPGGRTFDQVPLDQYPSAPAHDAPAARAQSENTTADDDDGAGLVFARGDNGLATTQGAPMAARGADVQTNDRDHEDDDRGAPDGVDRRVGRADEAPPCGARVRLPERRDPPGDRRADAAPVQQSFGPLGVDDFAPLVADDQPRAPRQRLVTLGEVWRANLEAHRKRKAAAS